MKKIFCPISSKIKLIIYFVAPYSGYEQKPETQYSLLNMNKKTDTEIIQSMEKSFLKKKYKGIVKTAVFYDNITGSELKKITY